MSGNANLADCPEKIFCPSRSQPLGQNRTAALFTNDWEHFRIRLKETGFTSYKDYLNSEHWKKVRKEFYHSPRYGGCCHECGPIVPLDLHHLTYERMGREQLDDLVALCRSCHESKHAIKPYELKPQPKPKIKKQKKKKACHVPHIPRRKRRRKKKNDLLSVLLRRYKRQGREAAARERRFREGNFIRTTTGLVYSPL